MHIDGIDSNEEWYEFSGARGTTQSSCNSHMISTEDKTNSFCSLMWANFNERCLSDRTILPMGGKVGGSVEAKSDSDGSSSVDGEVHVTVNDDDGTSVSVSAEGSVSTGNEGNVSAEGGIKISVEKEF